MLSDEFILLVLILNMITLAYILYYLKVTRKKRMHLIITQLDKVATEGFHKGYRAAREDEKSRLHEIH